MGGQARIGHVVAIGTGLELYPEGHDAREDWCFEFGEALTAFGAAEGTDGLTWWRRLFDLHAAVVEDDGRIRQHLCSARGILTPCDRLQGGRVAQFQLRGKVLAARRNRLAYEELGGGLMLDGETIRHLNGDVLDCSPANLQVVRPSRSGRRGFELYGVDVAHPSGRHLFIDLAGRGLLSLVDGVVHMGCRVNRGRVMECEPRPLYLTRAGGRRTYQTQFGGRRYQLGASELESLVRVYEATLYHSSTAWPVAPAAPATKMRAPATR